jgi:transcriptional regulator with XRE-family HTH domain
VTETIHRAQVGRRLRAAIDILGLTQTDVAKTLGASPSKLGNWIRGDNYPSEWFVKQFCDRYGITTDWLYRGLVFGMDANLADALWKFERAPPVAAPPKPKGRAPPARPTMGGNAARNLAKPDCGANVAKRRVVRVVDVKRR